MLQNQFTDYYEILQISPNADEETIERVFRHLAKKYHPDNTESANKEIFLKIMEAHKILSNPESRAAYDVRHQDYWNRRWSIASMASDKSVLNDDKFKRDHLLSLLYVQRRRSMKSPGLGEHEMARLLSTPSELLEFNVWYLKSKGWIERLDSGHLAITVLGVDEVESQRLLLDPDRLIEVKDVANDIDQDQLDSDE
jgi:hypothetical protein